MRFLPICAVVVSLAAIAPTPIRAQARDAAVQTTGAVHTATFETLQGVVRVHVSSDASAGDTISGAIVTEPSGATPQAQEANRARLDSLVVEWQGQQTPVSERRYEWLIPTALRAGAGALVLRDREGRSVSQASVPVDPIQTPAPRAGSPADAFELPTDVESGKVAVIRGPSDGKLTGRTVSVGGAQADFLAASPRQLAFRVPATVSGPVPVRLTSAGVVTDGTARVVDVRVTGPRVLLAGQRNKLTVTVTGLTGIAEPVTLTLLNLSPAVVRVENIDRPITIEPRRVTRQGTFTLTRDMTALRSGLYQIVPSVGRPPLAQFDVVRSMSRTLANWQARTGVGITPEAGALIQRSVLDARRPLDEFLRQQHAYQGDVEAVFAAILSHYCFTLRDDSLSRRRAADEPASGAHIRLVALAQRQAGTVEIAESDARRRSFPEFLADLIARFTTRQAVGYLLVRSMPVEALIAIDGQQKGDLTNKKFVTSVGDHTIDVSGPQKCRQRVTITAFQTKVVDCGAQQPVAQGRDPGLARRTS